MAEWAEQKASTCKVRKWPTAAPPLECLSASRCHIPAGRFWSVRRSHHCPLRPSSSSPAGVSVGFSAHVPSVLVSTAQTAPVQGQALQANWQHQINSRVDGCFVSVQASFLLQIIRMGFSATATLSEGRSIENIRNIYFFYTLVLNGAAAVNLLGASSSRPFSFSSTSMAGASEAGRSC